MGLVFLQEEVPDIYIFLSVGMHVGKAIWGQNTIWKTGIETFPETHQCQNLSKLQDHEKYISIVWAIQCVMFCLLWQPEKTNLFPLLQFTAP